MAYIRQIAEENATGVLSQVYDAARGRADRVANIIRLMSLDAESLEGSIQFYVKLMKKRKKNKNLNVKLKKIKKKNKRFKEMLRKKEKKNLKNLEPLKNKNSLRKIKKQKNKKKEG